MSSKASKNKGSKIARQSAARLVATQAVYQVTMQEQAAHSVIKEYIEHRFGDSPDGEEMVVPDSALFKRVVSGVDQYGSDIDELLSSARASGKKKKAKIEDVDEAEEQSDTVSEASEETKTDNIEPLLYSILRCGVYELMQPGDVDAPIIISDYMNVTDAFYDQGEKKLVNALLDKVSGFLKD